jgi:hypothetical protein
MPAYPSRTETVDLGFRPREWQADFYRRRKRFNALVVHRRGGKTLLAAMLLIDEALRCPKPLGRYAYVAPELKQAKAIAWDYLKLTAAKVPGSTRNESELWVEMPNGARIRLFGADNPDSLRGAYWDGVVLDEVAQMKPEVWGEVIRPALGDREGWALFIGTPKGINLFSEIYFQALDNPEWLADMYRWDQTGALSDTEITAMRADMSPQQWRQEMECDFSSSGDNALITLDLVDSAMKREIPEHSYQWAATILGVDVARQGADKTVIQRRQGLKCFPPIVMAQQDAMAVADAVAGQALRYKPDGIFVDGSGGYGAGVIDRLRQLKVRVTEVQFGGKPQDERFVNKRAEMWWRMREWLEQGGQLPKDPAYRIELTGPTYDHHNAAGRLQLESKEKLIARGLKSPDHGDALALTFAHTVVPPDLRPRRVKQAITSYDEFSPFKGR